MTETKRDVHTIDVVSSEVYKVLKEEADNEKKSLRSFVNELLADTVKSREFFNKKFDHLTKIKSMPGKVKIADERKGRVAEVTIENEKLQCNICDKDLICDHVTYSIVNMDYWKMLQEGKAQ